MSNSIDDKSDKNRFTEYLNEILSAENAIVERLHKRIQETQFPESKNTLQHELLEEKNHQSRLKNLISAYGGRPTDSKAKLLSLNSTTGQTIDITDNSSESDKKIKSRLQGDDSDNMNKGDATTPLESEILRTKEDAMIKNAEILGYKMVLKIAEKIDAKDAINTLKKNLQEKESTYNKLIDSASKMLNQIDDGDGNKKNHQYHQQKLSFQLGSAIADILTSSWNSKENPSKVYIFNRRVHHGAIGALLGLSNLYKNQPMITGILSGLGAGLAKDDYDDFREWFLFKTRKEDEDVK
jgi:ferritin-like metal-binding protein YciE